MSRPPRPSRPTRRVRSRPARRAAEPAAGSEHWPRPWVHLRSAAFHPHIYDRMIRLASPDASPGDVVAVFDKHGERFGSAFYNPASRIALRLLSFNDRPIDADFFRTILRNAVVLRRDILGLEGSTNAYRLFHSEGDGLSGLVIDRFDDVLSFEVFSLGVYRRLDTLIPLSHELAGTSRHRVHVDREVARREAFDPDAEPTPESANAPRSVRIAENGVRFAVDFASGHKTGFFCDQRENRKRFAELVSRVGAASALDLCCYTGGFAVAAKVLGGVEEVTGVDLDEKAIAQARHNANLNQVRVRWVHADAFSYTRQMLENEAQWPAVVLDPPKFIPNRAAVEEGRKKYHDLNRLAISLVEPGGLFVTCSCSGLLSAEEFRQIVIAAAHGRRRRLQLLESTGAGADHPVMSNCPESGYLKVLWWRVE